MEHLKYDINILWEKDAEYLLKNLTTPLNANFTSLDASRPWMTYLITHLLDLLSCLPGIFDLHTCVLKKIKGSVSDIRVLDLEQNDWNGTLMTKPNRGVILQEWGSSNVCVCPCYHTESVFQYFWDFYVN